LDIVDIIWKDDIVAKLRQKHGVSISEVEEALVSRPFVRKVAKGRIRGEDVYAALAQVRSGRYLIVFFIDKKRGVILPITARNMDSAERKYYAKRH
jgi:uncharacterized DUF497 family protein